MPSKTSPQPVRSRKPKRLDPASGIVHRMGIGFRSAQLRCGLIRTNSSYVESNFVTPQYAVVYIYKGHGTYVDRKGREHPLCPGSLFQRFPSQLHTVRLNAPIVRPFMAVPCQVFELFHLTGLASYERPVLQIGADRKLLQRFVAIREALRSASDACLITQLAAMQSFLMDLHERDRERRDIPASQKPVARAVQILNEDIAGLQRLPEIARKVNMSYSSFRKQFTEQMGTSPRDYRIRRRIERAMALLSNSTLLNKEIADRLGYPDEFAFSAQFKKMTGQSPRTFQNETRSGS